MRGLSSVAKPLLDCRSFQLQDVTVLGVTVVQRLELSMVPSSRQYYRKVRGTCSGVIHHVRGSSQLPRSKFLAIHYNHSIRIFLLLGVSELNSSAFSGYR